MNRERRRFLQGCTAAVTGSAIAHAVGRGRPVTAGGAEPLTNWAGNYTYSTGRVHRATSVVDVQAFVRTHPRFKVLGSRHCFNGIADSADLLLSLERMDTVVALDRGARTVTVEAGMRYGQLCPYLDERGFALHNLASLPHISIAGACATATHGSGVANGNLATAVSGLELVTAAGDVVTLSREKDGDAFAGTVVHLGALGVVTKVTLDVQPSFVMRQDVYLDMPMSAVEAHFEDIAAAGYSVSLFTDWRKRTVNEVWVKRRVESGESAAPAVRDFHAARPAEVNVHPIVELSAEHCTEQLGVPGPWYERLPHFRMGFTPSSGRELQSEYFVPRRNAVDAILAVERLGDRVSPHLMISELRTIAADDLWLSPAYRQPSLAIHFTWKQEPEAVGRLMPLIETELAPFGVRPHWGKLFTVPARALARRYEGWAAFRELMAERDPRGTFGNEFLNTLFPG
jgi:alditol oxidase